MTTTTATVSATAQVVRQLAAQAELRVVPTEAAVLTGHDAFVVRSLLFRALDDTKRAVEAPRGLFGGSSINARGAGDAYLHALREVDPTGAAEWVQRNGSPFSWVAGPVESTVPA